MAFHSRNAHSRHRRSARNDKESILGLSGWLFADLLLAIAVIFLVVEARGGSNDVDELKQKNIEVTAERDQALNELERYRRKGDAPAEAQGLIADASEQLFVSVREAGSTTLTRSRLVSLLENRDLTSITLGKNGKRYTWDQLRQERYRVGLMIWFAQTKDLTKEIAAKHRSTVVKFFVDKGLVVESEQWGDKTPEYGDFPTIDDYREDNLGTTLKFRIFLFKGLTASD